MEQTIATIMGWGATFSPRSWAFCQGQLIAIAQNDALFSLIGTIYGGDGRTTFALPDLRGRAPFGYGQSPGTSFWPIGARLGTENETLTQLNLPVHNHSAALNGAEATVPASSANAGTNEPGGSVVLAKANDGQGSINPGAIPIYGAASGADTTIASANVAGGVALGNAGGSQSFSIVQPVQAIHWIIALYGLYPQRN
ncbi:MAG: phage tail protein [Alphaproteobacteria bacterium]|jgi:microcystin-dependent protein|nr:phage tail protein [Alphaproteobacteria bacterium]